MYDYFLTLNVKLGSYFDEQLALQNIKAAFIGSGKLHIKRDEAKKAMNFYNFMIWFDKTYDLTGLRKSLYKQLLNWVIDESTAELSIVELYQTKVDLFDATEQVSTQDVVNCTKLDEAAKIDAILNAIKNDRKELWKAIEILLYTKGKKPDTMDKLKSTIKHAHDAILSINIGNKNKIKDPTITSNHTVNAINMRQFPALVQFDKNKNKYNQTNTSYNENTIKNNFNKNTNLSNGKQRKKIFKHKFNIPRYLIGYCNACRKWGHYASDCKRIHSNTHNKLMEYYISLRPKDKTATKPIVNQINITQTNDKDSDEDIEEVIIEPTNDIESLGDTFLDEFRM